MDVLALPAIAFESADPLNPGVAVSFLPIDEMKDVSLPARFRRQRRIIIPLSVAVLAVGAFLLWGPVGVGNGPLRMSTNGVTTWAQPTPMRVGDIVPISYAGSGRVTIDGITLVSGTSRPAPHLVAVELLLLAGNDCDAPAPAQPAVTGFVVSGCGGKYSGPLVRQTVGQPKNSSQYYAAGFEMSPPKAGGCWMLSDVVVHYHVGIRHYSAAEPNGLVVCAGRDAQAKVNAAAQAAISAGN